MQSFRNSAASVKTDFSEFFDGTTGDEFSG
jgi:hypothetical protein